MELKSKTKRKKEAEALQELGEALVRLTPSQIKDIPLPSAISEAVAFAKTLKRGALRRQLQYIGTLMRQYDTAPIKEALQNIQDGDFKKASVFKEIEEWRAQLMEGNEALMEDILRRYSGSDRQKLTQLMRNAVKERTNNKPPRAFRDLFRYLKKIRSEQPDIYQ